MTKHPRSGVVGAEVLFVCGCCVCLAAGEEAPGPQVETLCRGVEHRLQVANAVSAVVLTKEYLPPSDVTRSKSAARTWGNPDSLGFSADELTGRSLHVLRYWRTASRWQLERILAVYCGVNLWELYRRGRGKVSPPGLEYHTVIAGDGRQIGRWQDTHNMALLEPYDQALAPYRNHLETQLIQTGLFRASKLRKPGGWPQLRVVGRERLQDAECTVLQRKATPQTRPDNPNCYMRIWVAPERSYAILRWEDFALVPSNNANPGDSTPRSLGLPSRWGVVVNYVYSASEFREALPSFWIPWRTMDQAGFGTGADTSWRIRVLEVKQFAATADESSVLMLLPLGAQVSDFFEQRGYPNGWEGKDIDDFLAGPTPEPEGLRPLATLTGNHAPTEP
ncbi:MAG: hypothetical protein GW911_31755 [Armatimonadetes bacterium]|nr:hypothetical protein [Armatimonadota bacterium]NDK16629.1 hypothetical protein [Armatimonadota bacterium]